MEQRNTILFTAAGTVLATVVVRIIVSKVRRILDLAIQNEVDKNSLSQPVSDRTLTKTNMFTTDDVSSVPAISNITPNYKKPLLNSDSSSCEDTSTWSELTTAARRAFVEEELKKALRGTRAGFPKLDVLPEDRVEALGRAFGQFNFLAHYAQPVGFSSRDYAYGQAIAEVFRDIILDLNPDRSWREHAPGHPQARSPQIPKETPLPIQQQLVRRIELFLVAYFTWISPRYAQRKAMYAAMESHAPINSTELRSLTAPVFDRLRRAALKEISCEFVQRVEGIERTKQAQLAGHKSSAA